MIGKGDGVMGKTPLLSKTVSILTCRIKENSRQVDPPHEGEETNDNKERLHTHELSLSDIDMQSRRDKATKCV